MEQEEALINSIQPVEESDQEEGNDMQDKPQDRHGHRRDLEIVEWGAFDIALKVQATGKTSWECRCPFHKLSKTTGCKRTIEFNDDSKDHALIAAKWWCNQAQMHSRQKLHRKCFSEILEVPFLPEDVLISDRINELPTAPILTDAELDAIDRKRKKAELEKKKKAAAKGRGRGQGKGSGRGRAGPALPDNSSTSPPSSE